MGMYLPERGDEHDGEVVAEEHKPEHVKVARAEHLERALVALALALLHLPLALPAPLPRARPRRRGARALGG